MENVPNPGEWIQVLSGGSMAAPKRLSRPIKTWVRSAETEAAVFGISGSDRFAVLGSERHSMWAYAHFRAKQLGSPCVGINSISGAMLRSWGRVQPTVVYGVPELIMALARLIGRRGQVDLDVRLVLMGGGPATAGFSETLVGSAFPLARLHSFYGTAETSFIGHGPPRGPYRAFPSVELAIREHDRIWVRSPMTLSPGDWFDTGDLGAMVSPNSFQVVGRAGRQIVVKGVKYSVEPIEERMVDRFGAAHAALMSDSLGQVICVLAMAGPGPALEDLNRSLLSQELHAPLLSRLLVMPPSKWPRSAGGKTDYVALRALVEGFDT